MTPAEFMVYALHCVSADKNLENFNGPKMLACKAGLTERIIQKANAKLVGRGLVIRNWDNNPRRAAITKLIPITAKPLDWTKEKAMGYRPSGHPVQADTPVHTDGVSPVHTDRPSIPSTYGGGGCGTLPASPGRDARKIREYVEGFAECNRIWKGPQTEKLVSHILAIPATPKQVSAALFDLTLELNTDPPKVDSWGAFALSRAMLRYQYWLENPRPVDPGDEEEEEDGQDGNE